MRAVVYEQFGATPELTSVPDPVPPPDGVVVEVVATGVCRSDWHGWRGHDPTIALPHVPGHELAGIVRGVGADVRGFREGDRVTVPFVVACGTCAQCRTGNQQVCDRQEQPGFTYWGSFAELVAVHRADLNLVLVPGDVDLVAAASLGCRFATSFRAVVDQGRVAAGEWVAVHGCGGVGLSAVMIATAAGANVIAVDVVQERLDLARSLGAVATVRASPGGDDGSGATARADADVVAAVHAWSGGGVHLSLDAVGSAVTCVSSVRSLRTRGRHVQVGLLVGEESSPAIPMDRVLADELELLGCHGIQAHRYDALLALLTSGRVDPSRLVTRRVTLEGSIAALTGMDRATDAGVTVVTEL